MTNDGSRIRPNHSVVLGGDDLRGRHRAGVEEDRDEREAHRDLVGDHLGARAQAAEQGVRRAGGPAAEHDAVDADRGDRQHEQHGDRHVGQLQRGLGGRRSSTSGPNGMTAKVTKAGTTAMTGASRKTTLSAALGMMSSLSASFTPSASDCSRPKGPLHVGADAVLHPGHDPALEPDVEQRQQHQDHEDEDGLEQRSATTGPGRTATGSGRAGRLRAAGCSSCEAPFTVTGLPGEARSARTPRPKERAGTQTTSSGRSATTDRQRHGAAVTGDGRERLSPTSSMPTGLVRRLAEAGDRRRGAVARRCASPSCIEPWSSSCFQVASAKAPRPSWAPSARVGALPASSAGAGAVPRAERLHLGAHLGDRAEAERGPCPRLRARRRCRRGRGGRAARPGW